MMESVIDLHAHLLHGLDDGPATLEQSVAMARLAAHAGTREIVAVTHVSRQWPYKPALAQRRWEELQHLVRDVIRIHRACEVELAGEAVQQALDQPERYGIAGGRYLLVEMPDQAAPGEIEPLLQKLVEGGVRPILTHPELHPELARKTRVLARWVRAGALLQLSGNSLAGVFGRRAAAAAEEILKRGLAHFVASGGHDLTGRPPRLDAVRLQLIGAYPVEFVEQLLVAHPQAVLESRNLAPGPLREPFLKALWFPFGR